MFPIPLGRALNDLGLLFLGATIMKKVSGMVALGWPGYPPMPRSVWLTNQQEENDASILVGRFGEKES